ncbi:MAG: DUF4124 domain-containing protein [Burkholderiales bacterium]
MKTVILFISLFALTGFAQAQINKCVDSSGKTVYSQGPCPKGTKSSSVASAPAVSAPAAKAGDATKSTGPKTTAELDQEFRKRQQEQSDARKKDEDRLAQAKAEQENCSMARRALAGYEQGGRQSSINDKGERVFLEDAQIEAEKQRARQSVSQFCK